MLCPAYWKCFDYSIIISDINLVLRNCNCKFALRLPHITKSILLLQVWSYKRFYHSLEFFFLPICQCDKSSPSIMALQFNKENFQREENLKKKCVGSTDKSVVTRLSLNLIEHFVGRWLTLSNQQGDHTKYANIFSPHL